MVLGVYEFVPSAPSQETVTFHQYRASVQYNVVLTSPCCFKSATFALSGLFITSYL